MRVTGSALLTHVLRAGAIRADLDVSGLLAPANGTVCRSDIHRCRSRSVSVLVDDAAEEAGAQESSGAPAANGHGLPVGEGRRLASGLMRALPVVVPGAGVGDLPGVHLVPDQDMVGDLAPDGFRGPLAVWVHARSSRCCLRDLGGVGVKGRVEGLGVLRTPVAGQEAK
jgi:hypothetical protein